MTVQSVTFAANALVTPVPLPGSFQPVARRFSVDEYHRMIESGILTTNDRVQLVDGWIIEMPPIGPEHCTSTALAGTTIQSHLPAGWIMRLQNPVTLANGEPEPDVVVARGNVRDYSKRHPGKGEIALVLEVAKSTLDFDRRQKAREYSAAGIPEYWILNLVDRQLEVHREPQATSSGAEYRIREVLDASRAVSLTLDGRQIVQVKVADLLP